MHSRLSVLSSIFLFAAATAIVRVNFPLRLVPLPPVPAQRRAAPTSHARIAEAYGRLPLSFEANRGQADAAVKFLSRGPGYSLFLTSTEAVLSLNQNRDRKGAASLGSHNELVPSEVEGRIFSPWARSARIPNPDQSSVIPVVNSSPTTLPSAPSAKSAASAPAFLRMKLVGSNPAAKISGASELPGKSNYFIGNDPKKWRTNVPTFAQVKYTDVYPGIDLVYYGNHQQLEYDFIVSPGAEPSTIRLAFPGLGSRAERRHPERSEGSALFVSSTRGHVPPSAASSAPSAKSAAVPSASIPESGIRNPESSPWPRPSLSSPSVPSVLSVVNSSVSSAAVPPRIDAGGDLVLDGDGTELRLRKPIVYQNVNGARREISGSYVLESRNDATLVSFHLGAYDKTKPLVVDPVLVYSTYLGGSVADSGNGIAVDSSGSAYITGSTNSLNFPTTSDAVQSGLGGSTATNDAFVSKLDPSGASLVYSTYLGGSGEDVGNAIAVDASGNAFVAGTTASANFPTTPGAFQTSLAGTSRAFVTKLNSTGSVLAYSTYLGGSVLDSGSAIAIDFSGNAYVTGSTLSSNFPTTPGAFQSAFGTAICGSSSCVHSFVTKLNTAGSALAYSTYLGGNGNDGGRGIAVDFSGNAYVTGNTSSANFPTTPGAFQTVFGGGIDAFVTKLNSTGSALAYSTFLGGNSGDEGNAIAVDNSGNAYLIGETASVNFPTFPTVTPLQSAFAGGLFDSFVTKLNASGSALVYSTYLGGAATEFGRGIAVDSAGNAYVTGQTNSTTFPTTSGAIQIVLGIHAISGCSAGCFNDAYVAKIDATGTTLIYSTYLGGANDDAGNAIAVDSSGSAYVTGSTASTDFPTAGPIQATLRTGASRNAFVAKFSASNPVPVLSSISPTSATAGGSGFVLTVNGSNFVAGAVVQLNGIPFATNFVGTTQLTVSLATSDIPTAGAVSVTVVNPPPDGGTSNSLTLTINPAPNPVPVLTSLLPASATAGGPAFTLSVRGANFVSGSVVQWNGSNRVTTLVNSTQVTASILAGDIAAAGAIAITVFSPAPGGGTSNALTFTVTPPAPNPVPVLSSLSPATALSGGADFTLTANGSNFVPGASVQWNGSNRATTFISNTQLSAVILAADIAKPGNFQVTVFNPPPAGGASNALTFTITAGPPTINFGGIVNAASSAGLPLAAGAIASVFGTNFSASAASASSLPLPTTLGGVSLAINGVAAPLFAVTPQQINFQIPWEMLGQSQATIVVTVNGVASNPATINLSTFSPGIFTLNQQGSGQGAILIGGTPILAAPVGTTSTSRPARRGEFVTIFCTGLGPVTNSPATGAAPPTVPQSLTTANPVVTVGGSPAAVSYSGLAPTFVGLYQVNIQIPQDAPTGDAVSVALVIGGVPSNPVTLAVQ